MTGRRIAQVLGTSTGGIGTHVASVVRGLLERGDRVTVLGPAGTDTQFGFRAAGARFVPIDIPATTEPVRDLRAVAALRRALRGPSGGAPDVVHAHGLRAGLLSRFALPDAVPLAVTWHIHLDTSGGDWKDRLLRQAEKLVARSACVSLCTDPDQVTHVLSSGGTDVRYAPVAAPELPEPGVDADTVKAELGAAGGPLIVTVGRLHPVKRLDVLIDAAAGWRELEPRPLVVIAGDGPIRAELTARVERSGAPVRLLGHRHDIADLLAAADLAVITSESETRQLFAQEVLRAGKPLVATRAGGIPELVGDAACLVEPADVAALDAAVRGLLADPTERSRLAEAGPKRATGWPSETDTIDHLDALYRELTGR
jgi:glycosyltransferase involved in cell wall biosynthesis